MIRTVIFDLYGTLVQTEHLKALSYALAAGMHCLAVTTPFTSRSTHNTQLLPEKGIIDDPVLLMPRVKKMMDIHMT